jgi:hypothetical protein
MTTETTEPTISLASTKYIGGLTHQIYRYPAAAPPDVIRDLLLKLSAPDDVVLDPFMGGGTTVVEALAQGRRVVGADLNSLAAFVTRVKASPLTAGEWEEIWRWLDRQPLAPRSHPRRPPAGASGPPLPTELGQPLANALETLSAIHRPAARRAARCALLALGQWALQSTFLYPREPERRNILPRPELLDSKLVDIVTGMYGGLEELAAAARQHGVRTSTLTGRRILVKGAARNLPGSKLASRWPDRASLILTSPPYPGVHVLYHRWQVAGRAETSAPYWIAGQSDGKFGSYYTMGSRTPFGLARYFEELEQTYGALREMLRPGAVVAQLVAFSKTEDQLPRFLESMDRAGYDPLDVGGLTGSRDVPNRRWYARDRGNDAGREFLLVHQMRYTRA